MCTVIEEGNSVDLRGDASGSWQPVFCEGNLGYVSTDYLSYDGSGGSADDSGADGSGDESFAAASTGLASVGDTNGDGLRCRSAPASMTASSSSSASDRPSSSAATPRVFGNPSSAPGRTASSTPTMSSTTAVPAATRPARP